MRRTDKAPPSRKVATQLATRGASHPSPRSTSLNPALVMDTSLAHAPAPVRARRVAGDARSAGGASARGAAERGGPPRALLAAALAAVALFAHTATAQTSSTATPSALTTTVAYSPAGLSWTARDQQRSWFLRCVLLGRRQTRGGGLRWAALHELKLGRILDRPRQQPRLVHRRLLL